MKNPASQVAAKPWSYVQERDADFNELYDFIKELYSLPDKGNTSVQMLLTFDIEAHTASYRLFLNNDSANSVDLGMPTGRNDVPWAVALEMLGDEVEIPAELTSIAPSEQVTSVAIKAPVPAKLVSQAYTYAALNKLSRDVSACSEFDVIFKGLHTPEGLADDEIGAIVDALDFQRTGKPDFISKRAVDKPVARKLEAAFDVRVNIGGPAKYRFLDQAEIDVIVTCLDSMSTARESTFLNDGIGDLGEVSVSGCYNDGYPWQTGYGEQVSNGSLEMDGIALTRSAHLYTSGGLFLRDAIRHAEIVGDPVPLTAYERLQTLTEDATTSRQWEDPNFRESMRVGNVVSVGTHLVGLSLPHVGTEQVEKLSRDTRVDEAYVRKSLSGLCLAFDQAAVKQTVGLEPLLLADEFVHETLRRAAGVWEYLSWAKDDPYAVLCDTLPDAMRMWAVAHIVAERPENVVGLNVLMRCGEDPYFNGYFGAGAARWESATFIADNQFVAARTDESGLTHLVLFVGDSDPNTWIWTRVNDHVIDALHKQPDFYGQFGSLLIERGFPKQVSPELAKSALEVVKAHCTANINESRAFLRCDVLGFQPGTDVKRVTAWLGEHGATPEPVVDTKQAAPDNGPSAP